MIGLSRYLNHWNIKSAIKPKWFLVLLPLALFLFLFFRNAGVYPLVVYYRKIGDR